MTVSSPYKDIAPGQYKHGATTLSVEPGCNTPSKLGTARGVIAPESVSGQSKPVFHVEEGNICGTTSS